MKKFLLRMMTVCTVAAVAVTMALFFVGCSESSGNPNESNNPDDGNSANIEMVQIPGGSFQMGKELNNYYDEEPVHSVTLSGFYMSKYEVTQAQYKAVMGSNLYRPPSCFDGGAGREPASGEVQGNRPVENVSWYDAIVFCNKLSMAKNLSPAYSISNSTNPADWGSVPESNNSTWDAVTIVNGSTGYRLPTEAQWEYAAKGGAGSPGNYSYSGSNTVGEVAWFNGNSDYKTHEVGKKLPNGLGLYDMSGNVWEWCWDWYAEYPSEAQIDPTGAASGAYRVFRGGNFENSADSARSVSRGGSSDPSHWSGDIGFRLVRP
ncbi:MAG: formylglycine-generating enzyme family protein [Treponema sp.]|jgi:formylglycine-generating enzyme required for sulfatase activity|nr:formylglycine-generating enzyme family protein [Treponema sp.]